MSLGIQSMATRYRHPRPQSQRRTTTDTLYTLRTSLSMGSYEKGARWKFGTRFVSWHTHAGSRLRTLHRWSESLYINRVFVARLSRPLTLWNWLCIWIVRRHRLCRDPNDPRTNSRARPYDCGGGRCVRKPCQWHHDARDLATIDTWLYGESAGKQAASCAVFGRASAHWSIATLPPPPPRRTRSLSMWCRHDLLAKNWSNYAVYTRSRTTYIYTYIYI